VVALEAVEPPLDAAVVALDEAVVDDDDDDELPQAPTAIAAAMAKGIIFFKASLRIHIDPGRTARRRPPLRHRGQRTAR